MGNPDPTDFILAETSHIPFSSSPPLLSDWESSF
jgi:hypothetical protein